ncbi:arginine repressor [Streptococcus ovuberis]|uniref:Arginine repressor n=1 Tax=Streptococcus ovuberis TaxID=1936207 RepID=A0A7X6MXJ0_9STRE|nr:arginine repressor [Streptococcus ovuberis]NKZ20217.1 arginine repressor [Streptococcus ovuberis]
MRKRERLELIKELVRSSRLRTQKDVQLGLEERGVEVTQTTLSRDLRQLGLIKVREKEGSFYTLPKSDDMDDFIILLAPFIQKVERASFILVLHTQLGETGVSSNIIDNAKPEQILGTVAGANTLLVICRDEAAAMAVEKNLKTQQVLLGMEID